ncbi:MAG: sugar-binding domain-containing protein, partial [Christensenellales bacterium]
NELVAARLAAAFRLSGAFVVPEAREDYMTEQLILKQVSSIVMGKLDESARVGLGWGFLMDAFVNQFPEDQKGRKASPKRVVCPLIGGGSVPNRGYNPNEIVSRFSEKTGMAAAYLYAPAFPLSAEDRDRFTQTENYKEVAAFWEDLDLAVLRISNYPCTPDHATATRFGKKLMQKKAVGALLSYFFDENGAFISGEKDFCISIPLQDLKRTPCVVGICSANSSVSAIVGALRTGIFTHVVLDETKALKVIGMA